jgi:hypothetical protein
MAKVPLTPEEKQKIIEVIKANPTLKPTQLKPKIQEVLGKEVPAYQISGFVKAFYLSPHKNPFISSLIQVNPNQVNPNIEERKEVNMAVDEKQFSELMQTVGSITETLKNLTQQVANTPQIVREAIIKFEEEKKQKEENLLKEKQEQEFKNNVNQLVDKLKDLDIEKLKKLPLDKLLELDTEKLKSICSKEPEICAIPEIKNKIEQFTQPKPKVEINPEKIKQGLEEIFEQEKNKPEFHKTLEEFISCPQCNRPALRRIAEKLNVPVEELEKEVISYDPQYRKFCIGGVCAIFNVKSEEKPQVQTEKPKQETKSCFVLGTCPT